MLHGSVSLYLFISQADPSSLKDLKRLFHNYFSFRRNQKIQFVDFFVCYLCLANILSFNQDGSKHLCQWMDFGANHNTAKILAKGTLICSKPKLMKNNTEMSLFCKQCFQMCHFIMTELTLASKLYWPMGITLSQKISIQT